MTYQLIYDDFKCPITHEIFYEPVLISDGFMYEKDAIQQWFENNNTSPKTGLVLEHKNISKDFIFNKFFNEFLKLNKDIQRYKPEIDFIKCIKNKNYNKIINSNISNITYNIQNLTKIFLKNNNLIKFCIDNNINFINNINMNIIHFICKYSTFEMIKYIIDIYIENNYNLECENDDKNKPSDIIYWHSTFQMTQYIKMMITITK